MRSIIACVALLALVVASIEAQEAGTTKPDALTDETIIKSAAGALTNYFPSSARRKSSWPSVDPLLTRTMCFLNLAPLWFALPRTRGSALAFS